MATLTIDTAVEDGDTITAQTLHDMIENATIGNLNSSDLIGDELWCISDASPPNVGAGERFWWDTNHGKGQVLRVYAQPWNIWLAVGPDRYEIPLRNDSGDTLARGALCFAAGTASALTTVTGPTLTFVGFAQDTTASGAWAAVCPFGIGYVAWTTGATNPSNDVRGEGFSSINVEAGKVTSWSESTHIGDGTGAPIRGLIYGVLCENTSAALPVATVVDRGLRAKIWGPKLTTQPGEPR
jgi:hypothetical protein